MKTTCPISTINYNSPEHLSRKLNELVNSGAIDFWAFVPHKPEEEGEKPHNHVFIQPGSQLDSHKLTTFIGVEVLPDGSLVSNSSLWKKSKFEPWYLYSIHDPLFLESKGESRRFSYSKSDVWTSSPGDLDSLVREINFRPVLSQELLEYFALHSTPWADIVLSARVNPAQYMQWRAMYVDVCSVLHTQDVKLGDQVITLPEKLPESDGYHLVSPNDTPFNKE